MGASMKYRLDDHHVKKRGYAYLEMDSEVVHNLVSAEFRPILSGVYLVHATPWKSDPGGERYCEWLYDTPDGQIALSATVRPDHKGFWQLEFIGSEQTEQIARALCRELEETGARLRMFRAPPA